MLTLEKYVCVAPVSDTNLYCHALQNWCILSLMHLLMMMIKDISDVCFASPADGGDWEEPG